MAHKKGQGSTRNGRDSQPQRLGLKVGSGQFVEAGSILIRQRGTKWHPGANVGRGKDDTLFALKGGIALFRRSKKSIVFIEPIDFCDEEACCEPEGCCEGESCSQPVAAL